MKNSKELRHLDCAIIFIAPPLGGKDKQTLLLNEYFKKSGIPTEIISTGNEFRKIQKSSFFTTLIKNKMNKGLLLPDFLPEAIVTSALIRKAEENQILILNGFPRNKKQGKYLKKVMDFFNKEVFIFCINTKDEEIFRRREIREKDDKRKDDEEDVLIVRLHKYKRELIPLLDFLRFNFNFYEVDGNRDPLIVHEDIVNFFFNSYSLDSA